MTRLFAAAFFLLCVACSRGAEIVTLTITVTNAPSNGDTITVNSVDRTNVTSVATPANEILIGADAGAHATNLFNQFAAHPFTTLSLNRSGTNVVTLRGIVSQTIAASASGTWATLALSTNTTTNLTVVRVPATSEPNQASATNIFSLVASGIGSHSTSSIPAAATAMAHFANLTTSQSVSNKALITSTMDGVVITNGTGGFTNLWVTNFYGFGQLYMTNASPQIRLYDTDADLDEKLWVISGASGRFELWAYKDDFSGLETVFTVSRTAEVVDSVAFANGEIQITDGLKNSGTTKTPWVVNSALANGNNAAVDPTTATNMKLTAGPTAAFAICGISGGTEGRTLTIYNSIAQNMTVSNDSGADPTPANRIYTLTGGDIATTAEGAVTLVYDGTASRWIVTSFRD